jgi:5-bromo-4-chloroindolyl phosphate hydrolysis protein
MNLDDRINQFEENPTKTGKRWILKAVIFLFLITAVIWVVDLVLIPAKSAKEIINKTLDADHVLQNYEWFKQQNQDYEAINKKIAEADTSYQTFKRELPKERAQWTFEDKNELSRLSSILDGLKYQKNDIVSVYNARSTMMNRDLFKTNDLPDKLK